MLDLVRIGNTGGVDADSRSDEDAIPVSRVKPRPVVRKPRHGGSILMAAMIGLAEALGMDPEPTEISQPADIAGDDGFNLDYGGLPPLN